MHGDWAAAFGTDPRLHGPGGSNALPAASHRRKGSFWTKCTTRECRSAKRFCTRVPSLRWTGGSGRASRRNSARLAGASYRQSYRGHVHKPQGQADGGWERRIVCVTSAWRRRMPTDAGVDPLRTAATTCRQSCRHSARCQLACSGNLHSGRSMGGGAGAAAQHRRRVSVQLLLPSEGCMLPASHAASCTTRPPGGMTQRCQHAMAAVATAAQSAATQQPVPRASARSLVTWPFPPPTHSCLTLNPLVPRPRPAAPSS